jgi:hypothetical protein
VRVLLQDLGLPRLEPGFPARIGARAAEDAVDRGLLQGSHDLRVQGYDPWPGNSTLVYMIVPSGNRWPMSTYPSGIGQAGVPCSSLGASQRGMPIADVVPHRRVRVNGRAPATTRRRPWWRFW